MLNARLSEYCKFLRSLAETTWRLLIGMWKLTRFPQPAITIFGSARIQPGSPFAQIARELAKMLALHGFSIITGGGPGIMEAANEGAMDCVHECNIDDKLCRSRLVSAGIGLVRLNKEKLNPYVQENIVMAHFFARKWLLVRYSVGFVVFPGGFGTMDELFEIITLVQCSRMGKIPIVLVGREYWGPLADWIDSRMLADGMISAEDKNIITIVETAQEAFQLIHMHCQRKESSNTYDPEAKP